jgi:tetratricopeptide (TPR) repeat protein
MMNLVDSYSINDLSRLALVLLRRWGLITAIVFGMSLPAAELSESTIRHVQNAYQLQQQDKVSQAVDILVKFKSKHRYDNAFVHKMLGALYWQLDNPKQAIHFLTLAVDSAALKGAEHSESLQMLADLLLIEQEYVKSVTRYQQVLKIYQASQTPIPANTYELVWLRLAQAHYQQAHWAEVEASVNKQQFYQRKAKLPVNLDALKMKLGAQLQTQQWAAAIETTRDLRAVEPNELIWWRQLVSLYLTTSNQAEALVTLQQADRAGFNLDDQQLILLAQLYHHANVPYQAAVVLQRLSTLDESARLLAQQASFWQQAKEWDNAATSWKKAATLDRQYFRQYALLQVQQKHYLEALQAINQLNNPEPSMLLTKVSVLEKLGKSEQALQVATAVHQQSPSDSSLSWIRFLSQ